MEKKYRRRKAFIGAIIGAGLSIAGGLISGAKKKREAKRQAAIDKRNKEYDKRVQDANAINEALASYDDGGAGEEFEARLQKYGGVTIYKNRKAWGGWGDVISGTVSGIGSLVFFHNTSQGNVGSTGYQCSFSPKIMKTSSQTLAIGIRISWGRTTAQ